MQTDRTERDALQFTLAAAVIQAERVPRDSQARSVLAAVVAQLTDALDDMTDARRISLARAHALAESAVRAGLAAVGTDGAYVLSDKLRWARLTPLGVEHLAQLMDDEADDVEAFIAAATT